jgi:3-deoxy-D-manno-octulosonic acid kinase
VIDETALPPGYAAVGDPGSRLIASREHLEALERAGLSRRDGWQALLADGDARRGRGATTRVELPNGSCLRLKQLRRGGVAAALWRERFIGKGRLVRNVTVPLEALLRGIATAVPVALLMVPGPPGLFRGWMAFEELEDVRDLATCLSGPAPPGTDELAHVARLVRAMHDAGLEHRDLNLGNLLLRRADGAAQAFVIDLDGARLHAGPLPFRLRQRALRRLVRSHAKIVDPTAGGGTAPELWYGLYAADDAELARRLERGRRLGRWLLRIHRLGWRR